ncbi:TetR family transcriptional regulator [Nocardiopsis terrae]|uniref:AcrR family transcriptional regulator n=1 Tax=Nocardiopsis terrae TaxID=372655 RepID=A0ABR9HK57_9ACTN|nr:TetR/AcrR family transcriptional regulator [Nocardiopsis terrae]MBE1459379.1 AcrR family transcriptional regulator [Nocardiopsis terrae]GHC96983.1 TetR family transcriptional regulator [Nocardiopsis terrae]
MPPFTDRSAAERASRADHILDAAEELMVALGPRKVTVGDVARRAGVGKGTVYLHFTTKELLFLTVVMRAQTGVISEIVRAMHEDREAVRPSELARRLYLLQAREPVLRSMLVDAPGSLARLSHDAHVLLGDIVELRWRTIRAYWDHLREHGVLRRDRPFEEQFYAYTAIITGHMTTEQVLAEQGQEVPALATRAELIAQSVRPLLEAEASPEALDAARPRVIEIFTGLERRIIDEVEEQKRVKRTT